MPGTEIYNETQLFAAIVENATSKEKEVEHKELTVQAFVEQGILFFKQNPITSDVSVIIDTTKLPIELTNKSFILNLNGTKYPFVTNPYKATNLEIINLTNSQNELLTATIEIAAENSIKDTFEVLETN